MIKRFKRALKGFSPKRYETICQAIENTSASDWERIIDEWIFNDKHRTMLKERLLDGHTIEQISWDNGYSLTEGKKIILDGLVQIVKHI